MPSTIVQLVFGVAFGLIAYLALENSEQLKSIITPRSQEQESRIPKCQTISGLIVYRYSVPHTFPNFTTCDLEFDSFKKQMREVVNDQTIERLVTMHGYPIESTSQVIGHGKKKKKKTTVVKMKFGKWKWEKDKDIWLIDMFEKEKIEGFDFGWLKFRLFLKFHIFL